MVGLHDRPGGAGGKLASDPAAVETAAVALLTGYTDPLGLLAADREDYNLLVEIVDRAQELRSDRDRRLADYVAAKTAHALLPGLAKIIMRAIARAMRSSG